MEILKLLKSRLNWLILLAVALPLFSLNFYLLKNLPANTDLACSIGGYFNLENIIYALIYSFLFGVLILGVIEIIKRKLKSLNFISTSIASFILVLFTTTCTICVLPAISIFGINFSLAIFTTYNIYFKIIALVFIIISLVLIELNLKRSCLLYNCKINV